MAVERLPIVGVMGSGAEPHEERAAPLGRWLASQGVHLLTGGGAGVMAATSRAFCEVPERRGRVIGILPGGVTAAGYQARPGYPNPWVEIPIATHLPLSGADGTAVASRNHLNVLSSDVIVALPGSAGTASEVALALRYRRPLVAFLEDPSEIPALPAGVEVCRALEDVQRFISAQLRGLAGRPRPLR